MPLNLLKIYNQLLDIIGLNESKREASLMGVFRKSFVESQPTFRGKNILPTPKDGEIPMETLYSHLTTQITDKVTRKREFELDRSQRLHWIRHHLDEKKKDNMLLFSIKEPDGYRTYYYDKDEDYVIVLEPYRNGKSYYLLSAYHIKGKDAQRNKMARKYKRKLDEIL